MELSPGWGGEVIVKTAALLVPSGVVTVTFRAPSVALVPMDNVAAAEVALVLLMSVALASLPASTVRPETKLKPVKVTLINPPRPPDAGVMLLKAGGTGFTVKGTAPLVPPEVVTVMLRAPGDTLTGIVKVAAAEVPLFTIRS